MTFSERCPSLPIRVARLHLTLAGNPSRESAHVILWLLEIKRSDVQHSVSKRRVCHLAHDLRSEPFSDFSERIHSGAPNEVLIVYEADGLVAGMRVSRVLVPIAASRTKQELCSSNTITLGGNAGTGLNAGSGRQGYCISLVARIASNLWMCRIALRHPKKPKDCLQSDEALQLSRIRFVGS